MCKGANKDISGKYGVCSNLYHMLSAFIALSYNWDSDGNCSQTAIEMSSVELLFRLLLSQRHCSYFFPNPSSLKHLHFDILPTPEAAQGPFFHEIFLDHSQPSPILPSLNLDRIVRCPHPIFPQLHTGMIFYNLSVQYLIRLGKGGVGDCTWG